MAFKAIHPAKRSSDRRSRTGRKSRSRRRGNRNRSRSRRGSRT
jgi:hypothetical protein